MRRFPEAVVWYGLLIATLIFDPQPAFGQAFISSLTGLVTDPSGGAVPNATVRIKSVATGEERQAVTSAVDVIQQLGEVTQRVEIAGRISVGSWQQVLAGAPRPGSCELQDLGRENQAQPPGTDNWVDLPIELHGMVTLQDDASELSDSTEPGASEE